MSCRRTNVLPMCSASWIGATININDSRAIDGTGFNSSCAMKDPCTWGLPECSQPLVSSIMEVRHRNPMDHGEKSLNGHCIEIRQDLGYTAKRLRTRRLH